MNFEEFSYLAMSRQACRSFNDKEVEEDKIKEICELAHYAPSACNSQPCKMYCAVTREAVKEVAEALQKDGRNKFTSNAKAFIVISEKPAVLMKDVQNVYSPEYFVKYDAGELIAYITLAAKSLELDSCIIGWINEEKIQSFFNFEKNEKCCIVIALGYSDAPHRQKIRKPLEEIVSFK